MRKLVVFLFIICAQVAFSAELYRKSPYKDIRWLGRGNTGVAVIRDSTSMFYNPAGLGKSGNFSFDFGNASGGISANAYSNVSELSTLGGSGQTIGTRFSPFIGKPLSLLANSFPSFSVPYFGLGAFFSMDVSAEYRNPVSPEFNIVERDDGGVIGGIGLPIFPGLYVGASLRWFRRQTINKEISGSTLLTLATNNLSNFAKQGTGYGLNVGAQYELPVGEYQSLNVGFAVEDLGQTKILASTSDGPLDQAQSINLGVAYVFDSDHLGAKFLFDVRHLGEGDYYATGKMLHQGIEINVIGLDLRGGFYQGYWSAGFGFRWIPALRIDFSTYAEELDTNLGLRENRVYMLGISSGVSLSHLGRKKQKYSLDHL